MGSTTRTEARASGTGAGEILAILRSGGRWTRGELAERTGAARRTVTSRLEELVELGYAVRAEGESTGGRPPETFAFNVHGGVVLAADIGGGHTRVGVTDLGGRVLVESERDLQITDGPEAVLGWVADEFDKLLTQIGERRERVRCIGIGVPGPVEVETGRLVSPPIMTGWDGFVVPEVFEGRFGAPVVVDKDANIMALGEYRSEWAEYDTMVMVKVGMGVGCGIIVRGELIRGAQGIAGDIGHIPRGDAHPCRCGNHGCAEAAAGGWAIARDLEDVGISVSTSAEIVALTRAGQPDAVRLVRAAGRVIGEVVADLVSVINPSLVVIGGNLSECREPLIAGVREVVYARSQPLATRDLQITYSQLVYQAGLIGASIMVRDKVFGVDAVNAATAALSR